MEAMDDDLNTPNAYKVIFETVKQLNTALRQREIDWTLVIGLHNAIVKMLDVLGLTVEKTVVSNEDRQVYDQWQLAKQEKDFEAADKYRAILQQHKLI